MLRIAVTMSVLSIFGCSSVPDFRPSKPIEEASSLQDAIDLCAAYQIVGSENGSGRALPERAVVLVPWLNCFEKIFRKFPEAKENESFVMFFRALQSRHDGAPTGEARVIDWPQLNFAVRHAVEYIKTDSILNGGTDEAKVMARELPSYWIYLAESHRLGGESSPQPKRPRSHDAVTQALREDKEARKLPARPVPLTAEQREYCKNYLEYQSLLYNIQDLAEYKRVLEERTREDVSNANENAMKNRVNARYDSLKKEAELRRKEIDGELERLQAKSAWFKRGYCLDRKAGRTKKE